MSMSGKYFDQLETALGKGSVTGGYRSQAEQDEYYRRGVTKAKVSAHTNNDGYDFKADLAKTPEEFAAVLHNAGFNATRFKREYGGHNDGTGPHWHAEGVRPLSGPTTPNGIAVNSNQPGIGVGNPAAFLDGLEPTLAPESKASQNVSSTVDKIFGSDEEIRGAQANVKGVIEKQGQGVAILDEATQALHAVQLNAMGEQVQETQAISGAIADGTKQLERQTAPVFQARARIADQLDKINTMNPLERGIRGVFDLNYDRKYLENQLDHYDKTLDARAHDYDYVNKLHQTALNEVERRYGMSTAIPTLMAKQAEEDLGIVGQRLVQTSGMLGTLKDEIGTQSQMISAKAGAREDLLGRLDTPTVLDLANTAKAHGGVVTFNGVELSYHELRERVEKSDQQKLNMESVKMAIANGRMDLATSHATNLARSLTREQLEGAIAHNGTWQGIQLPQDVLTSAYNGMIQRDTLQAETIAKNLPATTAMQVATDSVTQITTLHNRTRGIFGPQGAPGAANYLRRGADLTRTLIEATRSGQPPEVITALTQQIALNSQAMTSAVDTGILSAVAGDKRAAGYVSSFVRGVPLDGATATQALTYFALKGGMPRGMGLSTESTQLFKSAQKLVAQSRGQRNPATGKTYTAAELETHVNEELVKTAGATIGGARTQRILNDLPSLAQKTGHPFGNLPAASWRAANQAAAAEAAGIVAKELNTTPEIVSAMSQKMGPLSTSQADQTLWEGFVKQQGLYNATEQGTLIREIDDLPQIHTGTRNSSMMMDFLRSPQLAGAVDTYTHAVGSASIGDYFANPIAVGATESILGEHAGGMESQQALQYRQVRSNARRQAAAMAYEPMNRVTLVLSSIEGLGKEGATALQPFVKQALEKFQNDPANNLGASGDWQSSNTTAMKQERFVRESLMSAQFQDKRLETYRKLAVKGFDGAATQTQGFVDRMLEILGH